MTVVANAMEILTKKSMIVLASGQKDDEPVASPCVSVCKMDAERVFCIGCLRTLDELRAWSTLDNAGKRAVWQLIEGRLP
jgi:predicted Fe-S protein YdhL (DUF1289 family)